MLRILFKINFICFQWLLILWGILYVVLPEMELWHVFGLIALQIVFVLVGFLFVYIISDVETCLVCERKESIKLLTLFNVSIFPCLIGFRVIICDVDGEQSIVYSWNPIEFNARHYTLQISGRSFIV